MALYPTDFTDESIKGIGLAVNHCILNDMELVVLYTYRLISDNTQSMQRFSLKKDLDAQATAIFDRLEKDYLAGKNLKYQLLSEVGFVDDRIEQNIKQHNISNILLCKSLYKTLEPKIVIEQENKKKLFDLPVIEVYS